ncbi:MAG: T9SS type A sorting domain-containing protein [Cyclobacteriaceae bacterium]|nr:T9SS type A sorting domain-containing protein [Cyclobacteriaceae bacterium]
MGQSKKVKPPQTLWIIILVLSVSAIAKSQTYCLSDSTINKQSTAFYRRQEILQPCKIYWINVYLHRVEGYGNGWTGYSSTIDTDILKNLNSTLNPYGFYFKLIGARDWINNFYTNPNQLAIELTELANDPNSLQHTDAINIYLLPSNSPIRGGFVPSDNKRIMIIGGTRTVNHCSGGSTTYEVATTRVVSHEMGHCLGLPHTFDGNLGTAVDNVKENACVDPGTCQFVSNCEYCNVSSNPTINMTNIMSGYTLPNCMSELSNGQVSVMREKLDDTMASVVDKKVELPSDIGELLGPSEVSKGSVIRLNVADQDEKNETFVWTVPDGFLRVGADSGRSIEIWIGSAAESGIVQVWKTNACGDSNKKNKYVTVIPDDCASCPPVNILPNPASDKIYVSYSSRESGDQEFFENPREYTIVDSQGRIVQTFTSKQTNVMLDLAEPNGFYMLNIKYGNPGTYRLKFIIAR